MPAAKKSEKRIKKEAYWTRLQDTAAKYKNVMFIDANNVSSKQIANIRRRLRTINAYMIMGKNTLMKASLSRGNTKPEEGDADYDARKDSYEHNPNIEKILGQLKGNTNLIFTNGDLGEIKKILDDEVRPCGAKPGMIAPDDVTIPAGSTGLDPRQTTFFQTLQISTKIVKAQIEIIAPKQVIEKGVKIDQTQAGLLDKLKIYPFSYKMQVRKVLQDGSVFSAEVLDLSTDAILSKFKKACGVQASLSLGSGYSTAVSAPHSLLNGFKNLVAVAHESGYKFPQADAILNAAKNAPAAGAATTGAAKAAPIVEEEKEEEVVDVGAGAFAEPEDDYY